MRYQVIAFISNSFIKNKELLIASNFFYVDSLRTLHVLEKKLMVNDKYDSWSVFDCIHPKNTNNLFDNL